MVKTVHELDHEGNGVEPPLVGALLRRPFMVARAHIVEQLHEAGFADLLPAHLAVFQHPGPDGRSPRDIARAAHMTKQAMNNLLAQLERAGYLHRAVNPANRRERTVELSDRGQTVVRAIRTAVDELEARWRTTLGANDYALLRSLLQRLNQELPTR